MFCVLCKTLRHIFRCINDVLEHVSECLHIIYPRELYLKCNTEPGGTAAYLVLFFIILKQMDDLKTGSFTNVNISAYYDVISLHGFFSTMCKAYHNERNLSKNIHWNEILKYCVLSLGFVFFSRIVFSVLIIISLTISWQWRGHRLETDTF